MPRLKRKGPKLKLTTISMTDRMRSQIDRLSGRIMAKSGASIRRGPLMRGIVQGALTAKVDFTGCATEEDVAALIAARLKKGGIA